MNNISLLSTNYLRVLDVLYKQHAMTLEELRIGFKKIVLSDSIINGLTKLKNLRCIGLLNILGSKPAFTIFEKMKSLKKIDVHYYNVKKVYMDFFSEMIIIEENTKISEISVHGTNLSDSSLFIIGIK